MKSLTDRSRRVHARTHSHGTGRLEHVELIFALLVLLDALAMQSLRDSRLSHGEVCAELLLLLGRHSDLRLSRFALQRQDGALQLGGQLALVLFCVTLLRLVRVTWEQDQSALVGLQTLHVLLERFNGSVLSAVINTNTDGWRVVGGRLEVSGR